MTQRSAVLGITEDVLDRCPVPVPVLHRGRFVRCGHIEVGHDERVTIDGVEGGELGDRQRPLLGAQGAAPPGAGVGGDLPGGHV